MCVRLLQSMFYCSYKYLYSMTCILSSYNIASNNSVHIYVGLVYLSNICSIEFGTVTLFIWYSYAWAVNELWVYMGT